VTPGSRLKLAARSTTRLAARNPRAQAAIVASTDTAAGLARGAARCQHRFTGDPRKSAVPRLSAGFLQRGECVCRGVSVSS
jgi:hypothetical protein